MGHAAEAVCLKGVLCLIFIFQPLAACCIYLSRSTATQERSHKDHTCCQLSSSPSHVCQHVIHVMSPRWEPYTRAWLLQDEDPYVRKTAAVCVAKLFDISPELVDDRGFLDKLRVRPRGRHKKRWSRVIEDGQGCVRQAQMLDSHTDRNMVRAWPFNVSGVEQGQLRIQRVPLESKAETGRSQGYNVGHARLINVGTNMGMVSVVGSA